MAKTYPDIGTFSPGDVLTAATMNDVGTNLDNQRVPPECVVVRTSNTTTINPVDWNSEQTDTDGMYDAGTPSRITIQTPGIYVINFSGYLSGTTNLTNPSAFIAKNGAAASRNYLTPIGPNAIFSLVATLELVATDYITAGLTGTGGTLTFVGAATNTDQQGRLAATWLGQVS